MFMMDVNNGRLLVRGEFEVGMLIGEMNILLISVNVMVIHVDVRGRLNDVIILGILIFDEGLALLGVNW